MIHIKEKESLFAYTFSHFCIDFACFFMLFHGFKNHVGNPETLALGFLIYNVTAFGLQPFIGYFCDSKKKIPIAPIGCGILVLGLFLTFIPWLALFICAFGNACFHVGGGIDSLINANGKMSRSGVFVSSGALGVVSGTLAGKSGGVSVVVPVLLLLISMIFMLSLTGKHLKQTDICFHITSLNRPVLLILCLSFAILAIRSYTGSIIPMQWRTTAAFMVLAGAGACIGKASGGFLADRYGAANVGVVSLLASIPLLCFGHQNPFLCTLGVLLFNMTMPLTLCAIADKLPGNPGLAFGLTTLCLLCGNIPAFFFIMPVNAVVPVIAILILISVICIFISMINQKGVRLYEEKSQVV